MRTFRFIRLWIIPLLSLIVTFYVPLGNPLLWLLWVVAFVSVCESGPSAVNVLRPAFWVGLHAFIVFQQFR